MSGEREEKALTRTGSFKMVERTENPIKFISTLADGIYSLLFIKANNENVCVVFANDLSQSVNILGLTGFDDFVNFDWPTQEMHIPDYFYEKFKQALITDECKFIVFPLFIINIDERGQNHCNMYIYDKKEKSLERFEPNGSLFMEGFFEPTDFMSMEGSDDFMPAESPNLDEQFLQYMGYMLPDVVDKYYPPVEFCPQIGFQQMQVNEREKIEADPEGFCTSWSVWYAELRLSNPEKSQKQVIDFALKTFKENNVGLTKFIRSYYNAFKKFARDYMRKNLTLEMIRKHGIVSIFTFGGEIGGKLAKEYMTKHGIKFLEFKVVDDHTYNKQPEKTRHMFITHADIEKIMGTTDFDFPIIRIHKHVILGDFEDLKSLREE